MASGSGMGRETRTSILPKIDPSPGFFGPDYNISDRIPTPAEIGVKRGSSLKDAVGAMKGMAYYVDTIGFGESSTSFSKGLARPVERFGVNYFLPTGARCSNGADAWMYVETIPKGDALGASAQRAMQQMGLPALRGLAPGIIEDAKGALDPRPMFQAAFGSGYPKCQLQEQRVGDPRGEIRNKDGTPWLYDISSVYYRAGVPYQKKWVQVGLISKEEYDADPKKYNKNGSEGFVDGGATLPEAIITSPSTALNYVSIAAAATFVTIALLIR